MAHELIRDPQNDVHLSAVSVLEMAINAARGKLLLPVSAGDLAADAIAEDGFRALPVGLDHAAEVERLPPLHRDPFDRLLVAQARVDNLTLVTSDHDVRRYPVSVVF